MTQAFFFDLGSINAGGSRPEGIEPRKFTKVAVLGAGMMGAGIAYVSAKAGMEVVLKDVDLAAAEKGKAYSEKLLAKQLEKGRTTQEKVDEFLARITPTDDYADLEGCDLVVEAVFESVELKHSVFGELEPVVSADALLGSNTSTLPITGLAEGVKRPEDFIGIHFFSPVDKMPLVEIIAGEKTNDATIAGALDYVQQIKKTPIVVNDSRGFFTSRVIGHFINEGLAMLGEGVNPSSLERAATQAGFPVGVLQISDELNLELMKKIRVASQDGGRGRGRHLGEGTRRGRHRHDDRARPLQQAGRQGLLRLRRERQAHGPVARPRRDLPGRRRAAAVPGHQGPPGLRDVPRHRPLPRGGCAAHGARREHRLDLRHRLPAPARWRACSTSTATRRPTAASASRRSPSGPRSWPQKYGAHFEPPALLLDKAKNGEKFA